MTPSREVHSMGRPPLDDVTVAMNIWFSPSSGFVGLAANFAQKEDNSVN